MDTQHPLSIQHHMKTTTETVIGRYYGSIHPSTKMSRQIFVRYLLNWSKNVFPKTINYIKSSTPIPLNWAIAVCLTCPVYSNSTIKKYFHHHSPIKYVNITGEIQPALHPTVNVLLKTLFITAYASAYRYGTRRCDVCITVKYIIARANQKNLFKKRTEIILKCWHRNKFVLKKRR